MGRDREKKRQNTLELRWYKIQLHEMKVSLKMSFAKQDKVPLLVCGPILLAGETYH